MELHIVFDTETTNKGFEYVREGRYKDYKFADNTLSLTVIDDKEYHVQISYDGDSVSGMKCTCDKQYCAHSAAACFLKNAKDESLKKPVDSIADDKYSLQNNTYDEIEVIGEGISLKASVNKYFCYAIQLNNGNPMVKDICITNTSEDDIEDYLLHIETDNELIKPFNRVFDLNSGESETIKEVKNIVASGRFLAGVTDTIKTVLTIEVIKDEESILSESVDITVLPYDFWPGIRYGEDLLAAYIIPNHPVITGILKSAGEILNEIIGCNAFTGYQSENRNIVTNMAKAIYLSLEKKNIQYLVPAISFEDVGQRVRLPEEIEAIRMGTCLDISLLYLACLESAGINGTVMLIEGHAFIGIWLENNVINEKTVNRDISYVRKKIELGELLGVNAVEITSDSSFESAVQTANDYLSKDKQFDCMVDVNRARSSGVRSIPIRMMDSTGYSIEVEDKDISDRIEQYSVDINDVDLSDVNNTRKKMTKMDQWERSLLNLSKTNVLVNTRKGKTVEILRVPIDVLEDMLNRDTEFVIKPVFDEIKNYYSIKVASSTKYKYVYDEETLDGIIKDNRDLLLKDLNNNILHAFSFSDTTLDRELKKLYKANQSSIEESGNNVLYMSIGMLKWKDRVKDKKFYRSPIILVPVDIIYTSVNEGVKIKKRDADPVVNMTLIELLRQEFKIDISSLEQPPEDEYGLDVKKIFAIIRQAIINMEGWDVLEDISIGIFSFKEYMMWNDIHTHPELLENHKVVKSLISGVAEWDTTIPEKVETDIPYQPLSVDASQIRAVNMAANNVSFILQGPPGTGKSQTITVMIANALMKGKRVLFVAEKEAALNVVSDKLKSIGLDDFCLRIYGKNEKKKDVLDQIARNMQLKSLGIRTEYEKKRKEIGERKAYLDAYASELHKELSCGMSIRQLIDEYEGIQTTTVIRVPEDFIESCNSEKLDISKGLLVDLISAGREMGHPSDSVFKDVHVGEYSQSLKRNLEESLYDCSDVLKELDHKSTSISEVLGKPHPNKYTEWKNYIDVANAIHNIKDIPVFLLQEVALDEAFLKVFQALFETNKLKEMKRAFLYDWNEKLLERDMADFSNRIEEANRKIFGKLKAIEAINSEISSYSTKGIHITDATPIIEQVNSIKNQTYNVETLRRNIDPKWDEILKQYNTVEQLKEYRISVSDRIKECRNLGINTWELSSRDDFTKCIAVVDEYISAVDKYNNSEKKLADLLQTSFENDEENWLYCKQNKLDMIANKSSELKRWIAFQGVKRKCEESGLGFICDLYMNGTEHDELIPAFLKSIYKALIWKALDELPDVNRFNGHTFNDKISQFKEMDDEFIQITREEILYQLRAKTPSAMGSIAKSINGKELNKAIKSGGRGTSIRKLMSERFATIITCCPCMLMTPLTVAKYIPAKNDVFDLVIFDEASQLPTAQAVGTIARGKNAVIVGDPNQMPPTSFFNSKYEDYENVDIEDLESILDDCQVIGMPDTHLAWHYRSRHESLIAFSNRNYYDNNMLTFPSVNDRERRITLITVNGRKKNNINEKEAHRVIEEVLRRYKDEKLNKKSIGIITFNISQRRYIEKLLAEEYSKDSELELWANPPEDERKLFVKNLENVQGDERDIILFSMTFGYNTDGGFTTNFGPLNKEGGWRRLNVAVSRAKEEMVIFTSMTSGMISSKCDPKNMSPGVRGVYDFLKYAETGVLAEDDEAHEENLSIHGIKESIVGELEKHGYKVKTDLGFSGFRIDIAVVNPKNEFEYILGIMLDGETYKLSENTRDREVAQVSALKGLGWNISRIWTMDWWDDSERELKNLLSRIEKLVEEYDTLSKTEWIPESEEIIPEELSKGLKPPKESENPTIIQLTEERFNPKIPHTESKDELQKEMLKKEIEKLAQELTKSE